MSSHLPYGSFRLWTCPKKSERLRSRKQNTKKTGPLENPLALFQRQLSLDDSLWCPESKNIHSRRTRSSEAEKEVLPNDSKVSAACPKPSSLHGCVVVASTSVQRSRDSVSHLQHLDSDEGVSAGRHGLAEVAHQRELVLGVHEDLEPRPFVRPRHVLVLLDVQSQPQPSVSACRNVL